MRKVKLGNPLLAVAYIRVSTDDQSNGVEAQLVGIRTWCDRQGVSIWSVHVDEGVSGRTEVGNGREDVGARKGWRAALDAVTTSGAGLLLVHRRDRIARDVAIACDAERGALSRGARVTSADGVANGSSPSDAMLRSILDAFAAQERAMIGARTAAALAVKRARGEAVSHPPYGFQRDRAVGAPGPALLQPDPREQATIAAAKAGRARGLSYRALARDLAAAGHLSRSGRAFTLAALFAILRENKRVL